MSRTAALALALAVVAVGCAGRSSTVRLPAGARVLARGSMAYAVAFASERVVSIELEERFALVVRTVDGRVLGRFDLGPPERDLPALAVAGEVAWLGGDDQRVRALALTDGAVVTTWPTGTDVTALAVVDDLLAIADVDGALCLRRLADGALLQCAQLADRPLTGLTAAAGALVVSIGDRRLAVAVPSLRPLPPPGAPALVARGRELRRGPATRVRLAGAIRGFAVDERGRLAVAAWIAGLADPSVVLVPPAR